MDIAQRVRRLVQMVFEMPSAARRDPSALPPPFDGVEEIRSIISAIEMETSLADLGDILRVDIGLEVPFDIVVATYRRLFELGVSDARSWLCYAYYLKLHGPMWDDFADEIIAKYEDAGRVAGLYDNPTLGHHPVFYSG